jgi:hypothetical protein
MKTLYQALHRLKERNEPEFKSQLVSVVLILAVSALFFAAWLWSRLY